MKPDCDKFRSELRAAVGSAVCSVLGHRVRGESSVLSVCTRCKAVFVGGHQKSYSGLKFKLEEVYECR